MVGNYGHNTGYPLGVSSPMLGIVMTLVFATIWGLWASTAKSFGGQNEEDGLSL